MKKLRQLLFNWQLRRMVRCTGQTERYLEELIVYLGCSLEELLLYYRCFGQLPEPEQTILIRHYGIPALIKNKSTWAAMLLPVNTK